MFGSGGLEQETKKSNAAREHTSRAARLNIGNLSQDRGAFCTGGGRNVGGSPMPRFVRKQSESGGFLGLRGKTEAVGVAELDIEFDQTGLQHLH